MAGFSTACAIAGATARPRSCSSRTNSSRASYSSSRPPARSRSAITACWPPAPAGAIAWSRRGLSRARPRRPRAAGPLRTRRRARKREAAPGHRTAENRGHQRQPKAAAHYAATPGRICCDVCSRWTSWSVLTAAGGCGSSRHSSARCHPRHSGVSRPAVARTAHRPRTSRARVPEARAFRRVARRTGPIVARRRTRRCRAKVDMRPSAALHPLATPPLARRRSLNARPPWRPPRSPASAAHQRARVDGMTLIGLRIAT